MKQWIEDAQTPSDMPIKMNFGNWNSFVRECGFEPYKPYLTERARLNSIKARKGGKGGNNKGGKIRDAKGYVLVWMPEHPNAKVAGYVYEHRLVMSKHLGRALTKHESVHHKNGIKDDNRLSNLELMTHKVHRGIVECPHCKKEFSIR